MRAVQAIISAVGESMAPDGHVMRIRFRTTADTLVTLGVALLAVVLAVGFQVVGRWARRSGWVD